MGTKAGVLQLHKAGKACQGKHSILLCQFISYEENDELWTQFQELYSQHFIFFFTQVNGSQNARVFVTGKPLCSR